MTEMFSFKKHILFVNRNARNQVGVEQLLALLKNGVPRRWRPYIPYPERSEESNGLNLLVDNIKAPKFLGKTRRNTSPEEVRWARNKFPPGDPRRNFYNALNSLINEMQLAPEIDTQLRSGAATRLVRRYGFHSIRFIEPLVGMIIRETSKKLMFYEFVPGRMLLTDEDPLNPLRDLPILDDRTIEDSLEAFFRRRGITPWDLGTNNMLARVEEGKKLLFLLDIEGFTKA